MTFSTKRTLRGEGCECRPVGRYDQVDLFYQPGLVITIKVLRVARQAQTGPSFAPASSGELRRSTALLQ